MIDTRGEMEEFFYDPNNEDDEINEKISKNKSYNYGNVDSSGFVLLRRVIMYLTMMF